jgi:hypothetical protein
MGAKNVKIKAAQANDNAWYVQYTSYGSLHEKMNE